MYKSKILKTRRLNCNIIYYIIINLKIFAHLFVYYSQHPSQKVFAAKKKKKLWEIDLLFQFWRYRCVIHILEAKCNVPPLLKTARQCKSVQWCFSLMYVYLNFKIYKKYDNYNKCRKKVLSSNCHRQHLSKTNWTILHIFTIHLNYYFFKYEPK